MQRYIRNFFYDKEGRLAVWQRPNVPLVVWIGASLLSRFIEHPGVSNGLTYLAFASGGYWAASELIRGDSPFRRVLGGIVLSVLFYGLARTVLR